MKNAVLLILVGNLICLAGMLADAGAYDQEAEDSAIVSVTQAEASKLSDDEPAPPQQPLSGPGGSDYAHHDLQKHVYGRGENEYWIFEPAAPIPAEAPLIGFIHGWSAYTPAFYERWIEHIVRRGNIVVYPRYQLSADTAPHQYTPNAVRALKSAIIRLRNGEHVFPQLDNFALVGHSAGGTIAVNIALRAADAGLPQPKALMSVQPGGYGLFGDELESLSAEALMLVVVGDDDQLVGDRSAKDIFYGALHTPLANKDFITVVSDAYGAPDLVADHFSPLAPVNAEDRFATDALDYYGYWKLCDGLTDYAFFGMNRDYALGNTPEQRFMGFWSDGTPVHELIVSDQP